MSLTLSQTIYFLQWVTQFASNSEFYNIASILWVTTMPDTVSHNIMFHIVSHIVYFSQWVTYYVLYSESHSRAPTVSVTLYISQSKLHNMSSLVGHTICLSQYLIMNLWYECLKSLTIYIVIYVIWTLLFISYLFIIPIDNWRMDY